MKFTSSLLVAAAGLALAIGATATKAHANQVITFDNLVSGDVAGSDYPGVVFTGASVLTQAYSLNAQFPPFTLPNVVYNYQNNDITLTFSVTGVDFVGAYVTGNTETSLTVFSGAVNDGSVNIPSANYTGSGSGLNPNIFLSISDPGITSAVFTAVGGSGFGNNFTLDNVTIGGANVCSGAGCLSGTPIPAALPLFAGGLGVFGFLTGRGRRNRKASAAIATA